MLKRFRNIFLVAICFLFISSFAMARRSGDGINIGLGVALEQNLLYQIDSYSDKIKSMFPFCQILVPIFATDKFLLEPRFAFGNGKLTEKDPVNNQKKETLHNLMGIGLGGFYFFSRRDNSVSPSIGVTANYFPISYEIKSTNLTTKTSTTVKEKGDIKDFAALFGVSYFMTENAILSTHVGIGYGTLTGEQKAESVLTGESEGSFLYAKLEFNIRMLF